MKRLIAGALMALAAPAGAEVTFKGANTEIAPPALLAALHARSGTVAPPYAWAWDVMIFADGTTQTTYCKGYQATEPGCASRRDRLTADQLATLNALAPTLTSAPENPNPPIGGGATWAEVGDITLPAHPLPEDAPRVAAALDALTAFIPAGALDDTAQRAKAP